MGFLTSDVLKCSFFIHFAYPADLLMEVQLKVPTVNAPLDHVLHLKYCHRSLV